MSPRRVVRSSSAIGGAMKFDLHDPICTNCNYPRHPPDGGTCPECGLAARPDTRSARRKRLFIVAGLTALIGYASSVFAYAVIMHRIHGPFNEEHPDAAMRAPARQIDSPESRLLEDLQLVPAWLTAAGIATGAVLAIGAPAFARLNRFRRRAVVSSLSASVVIACSTFLMLVCVLYLLDPPP